MTIAPTSGVAVAQLLATGGLRAAYQPIVELASEEVVGYEALARGPAGTALEMPAALFAAAEAEGLGSALDRACREVALEEALASGLTPDDLLFLNVEPAGLEGGGVLDRLGESRLRRASVVVELTERTLTTRPAEVLAAVRWLRERGCRIALDDVGVDPRSLALMPFLAPDVIKLDISVTQDRLDSVAAARALNAVGAEVERSGAILLAEGIETTEHLQRARSLGASLGQGWLFGRPAALRPTARQMPPIVLPRRGNRDPGGETPFERVSDARPTRRGNHALVLSLSRQLEDEVQALKEEAVLVTHFQHARHFTAMTLRRYERLAEGAALVAALGAEMPTHPGTGVRGARIPPDDRLLFEWDVIVVGPHFAAAFVAREIDPGEDGERQFDYLVTYDRELSIAAADALLGRVLRSD